MQTVAVDSLGLMVLLLVFATGMTGAVWLFRALSRSNQHHVASADALNGRSPLWWIFGMAGGAMLVGMLVAGLFMVRSAPHDMPPPPTVVRQVATQAIVTTEPEGASVAVTNQDNVAAEAPLPTLPAWTQKKETVVREGLVPEVLLVSQSALCATEAQALAEAKADAMRVLKARLLQKHPQLSDWQVPGHALDRFSLTQTTVESRSHDFGTFQSAMYVGYVQFRDSPQVRESLLQMWEQTVVADRLCEILWIALGSIAGLAGVSGVLRHLAARRQERDLASGSVWLKS